MMANGELQIVHKGPSCIYICVKNIIYIYITYLFICIYIYTCIPYILVYLCKYSSCPVATSGIPRKSITSSISSYLLYRSGVCNVQIYPSISDTGEFLSLTPSQRQVAFERLTHKTQWQDAVGWHVAVLAEDGEADRADSYFMGMLLSGCWITRDGQRHAENSTRKAFENQTYNSLPEGYSGPLLKWWDSFRDGATSSSYPNMWDRNCHQLKTNSNVLCLVI